MMRVPAHAIFAALLVCASVSARAAEIPGCPETTIVEFHQRVSNRETAKKLLAEFFSPGKGFPEFNEKMLQGPYQGDPSVPDGSYSYYGWYGDGERGVGGILYPDGRLVRRGYCK